MIRATGADTPSYETDNPCTLQVTPNQTELEVISSLDQCSPVNNPSTASEECREWDGEDAPQTSCNKVITNPIIQSSQRGELTEDMLAASVLLEKLMSSEPQVG